MRVDVFASTTSAPARASFEPPGELELDTSDLEDGPHVLRVQAAEGESVRLAARMRRFPFVVRNGPGIAGGQATQARVVAGAFRSLVNAYEPPQRGLRARARRDARAGPDVDLGTALVVLHRAMVCRVGVPWPRRHPSQPRRRAHRLRSRLPPPPLLRRARPRAALGSRAPVEGPRGSGLRELLLGVPPALPDRVSQVSFPARWERHREV